MMFALRKVISTILINLFMKLVASKLCNNKYECKNMETAITKDYIRIGLVFDRCVMEFTFEIGSGWKTYRFDREIRLIWQGGTRPKHELKHAMKTLTSFVEKLPYYVSPVYKRLMTHQDGKAMVESNE